MTFEIAAAVLAVAGSAAWTWSEVKKGLAYVPGKGKTEDKE